MRPRILVVDDHELVRRGIVSVIEREGTCKVCGEAADGSEALRKVRELKPDLVTLDVSMPVMGGLEAARRIRHTAPSTKIVMVTMHNSDQIHKEAAKHGANAVVTKMELATQLTDVIKALLKK